MKSCCGAAGALTQLAHMRVRFRLKRQSPDLAEFLTSSTESVDHAFDVHLYRVEPNIEAESEQRGLSASSERLPDRFVFLHQGENAAHHLMQHGAQVGTGVLGIVQLGAQETLAHPKAFGDGDSGHPNIDAVARDVGLPVVPLQVARDEPGRDSEFAANWLAHAQTVQRPRQRIDNAVGDGPIVLVALVIRSHEVKARQQNWTQQVFDPLRGNGTKIGIDDRAGLGAERRGHLKDQAERAAFSRNPMVWKRKTVGYAHWRGEQHEVPVFDARRKYGISRVVARSAVGVNDHPRQMWKVFRQTRVRGPHHVPDGPPVVIAGNANNYAGLPDGFRRAPRVVRQSLAHGD